MAWQGRDPETRWGSARAIGALAVELLEGWQRKCRSGASSCLSSLGIVVIAHGRVVCCSQGVSGVLCTGSVRQLQEPARALQNRPRTPGHRTWWVQAKRSIIEI